MRQTVIGSFPEYTAAQRAADYLAAQGIERDHIHLQARGTGDGAHRTPEAHEDQGLMANVRSFFAEVFGPESEREHLQHYADHLKRGGAMVVVDVDEETQAPEVCRKLKDAGALDLDQRACEWRSSGWSGFDEGVSPAYAADRISSCDTVASTRTDTRSTDSAADPRASLAGSTGSLGTGGMAGTPARMDSMGSMGGGSMGSTQAMGTMGTTGTTGSMERTQAMGSTSSAGVMGASGIPLAGSGSTAPSGEGHFPSYHDHWNQNYGALGGRYEDYEPAYLYGHRLAGDARYQGLGWAAMEPQVRRDWEANHPGSTWERVKDSVRHAWERASGQMSDTGTASHDAAYREHFDRNYSHMGAVYDEYEPAYRYGSHIATDSRYKGQDWDTIEGSARSDWESRHASGGSVWERFKGAVRHAWERARH